MYALLGPPGIGAGPRLRFNSRDLAEAGTGRPIGWASVPTGPTAGFWPLGGADLALAARASSAQGKAKVRVAPPVLETDLEADLASIGLGLGCLAPRIGGASALAAERIGARLRLPWGSLGAWSASRWQRLRAGWLFRGDAVGGCAFLLAEIEADAVDVVDLSGDRSLRLSPHAHRRLELEVEPAESAPVFAIEEPELVSVG